MQTRTLKLRKRNLLATHSKSGLQYIYKYYIFNRGEHERITFSIVPVTIIIRPDMMCPAYAFGLFAYVCYLRQTLCGYVFHNYSMPSHLSFLQFAHIHVLIHRYNVYG